MTKTATVKKRDGAPDFVFGSFGFKPNDLLQFVNKQGYVNFDILRGKESGYYVKISDYGVEQEPKEVPIMQFDEEEIPF